MNTHTPIRTAIMLLALAALPLACSHAPTLAPPDLHLNQDTCHECGMTVSDPRHAAAVVTLHDGLEETYVFDDTGEMLSFTPPANCTAVRRYAHDFPTGRWIDASSAHFVQDPSLHTPMATGIVAYADPQSATSAAAHSPTAHLLDHPFQPPPTSQPESASLPR